MIKLACGYAGMSIQDFWKTEIRHILAIIYGKHEEMTAHYRQRFEASRFSVFYLINSRLKIHKQYESPQKMLPFGWEMEQLKIDAEQMKKEGLAFMEKMRSHTAREAKQMTKQKKDADS